MKIYEGKDGKYVTYEKANGWYHVRLCSELSGVLDKVRCDSYSEACAYRKSFIAIARA